jgi:Protein of unknown function (DUF3306)
LTWTIDMDEPDEPENFLQRWSRRKQAATRSDPAEPTNVEATNVEATNIEATPGADAATPAGSVTSSKPTDPALDISLLPPIESITAETDIRAFLAPGVPLELRHAALRRAWSQDPAIRNFVGLADYDWDFTAPDAVPGFGPLEATAELRRQVARIVGGEIAPDESTTARAPAPDASIPPVASRRATPSAADDGEPLEVAQISAGDRAVAEEMIGRDSGQHVAVQKEQRPPVDSHPRRSHGGALPE